MGEVESPNPVVDYVLYLACALFSVTLGYIEFRFEVLKAAWITICSYRGAVLVCGISLRQPVCLSLDCPL